MCKLMLAAGLKKENKQANWNFILAMSELMTGYNNDGLGYTAVDPEGNLFGERWLNNDDAFVVRSRKTKDFAAKFNGFLQGDDAVTYNKFGKFNEEITAVSLHTRMATSAKGMNNVHPFVDESSSTSLVHNGVIRNVLAEDNVRSTCDSERILNMYLKHDIAKELSKTQAMIDDLRGYFACGIFSKDEKDIRVLDIFKSRANLEGMYVKELGTVVYSTDGNDIKKACKHLGFTITGKFKISDDILTRLNAITGEPLWTIEYKDTANKWDYPASTTHSGYPNSTSTKHTKNTLTEKDFDTKVKEHKAAVTEEELKQTKDIIASADKMNLLEATKDGWTYNEKNAIWYKNKAIS